MKILNLNFDLDDFLNRVHQSRQRALFLDYDGTLAPFQIERNLAVPYPGVREILSAMIQAGKTKVVIVSGRSTRDLIPLLGLHRLPEIWGSHGHERLHADGSYEVARIGAAAETALGQARQKIDALQLASQFETKPGSLALHWRGLPATRIDEIQESVSASWSEIAQMGDLVLTKFDGGLELRVRGIDKGIAVRTVLAEMHDVACAYLGDDLTDEDAFREIRGKGAAILVRTELRPTAADFWLKPPEELLQFLVNWHQI